MFKVSNLFLPAFRTNKYGGAKSGKDQKKLINYSLDSNGKKINK